MKTLVSAGLAVSVCCAVVFASVWAAGPRDNLSVAQREVADALLASQHPYAYCTDTIASCLKQTPVSPLALRLERAIYRMVAKGLNETQIEQAMQRRRESMLPSGPAASFVMDERFMAGDPAAPVVATLYACARSPLCAKLLPGLYGEVTTGHLAGKVRLYFRPYYQPKAQEAFDCSRALVASAKLGRFWKYLLALYREFDDFTLCKVEHLALMAGLNEDAFNAAYDDPTNIEYLQASLHEAERNKVDTAPTLFIGGRKYLDELSLEAVTDVLEEEWERIHSILPGEVEAKKEGEDRGAEEGR